MAILALAARTRFRAYGALVALAVPAAALAVLGVDSVAQVSDVGEIPPGLPMPALPDLSLLSPGLIVGASAIAAIVLVQGVGVAESVPNPGGRPAEADRDFVAQGLANLAAGLFRSGLPWAARSGRPRSTSRWAHGAGGRR